MKFLPILATFQCRSRHSQTPTLLDESRRLSLAMVRSRWQMSCKAWSSEPSSSCRQGQGKTKGLPLGLLFLGGGLLFDFRRSCEGFLGGSRAFSARRASIRRASSSTLGPWPGGGGALGPRAKERRPRSQGHALQRPGLRPAARCALKELHSTVALCLVLSLLPRAPSISSLGDLLRGLLLALTQEPRCRPWKGRTD